MARSISLNNTSYSIPQTGDSGWSLTGGVDDYLVALATGVLSKAGGTFTLTAEVDFGATYGLKPLYVKSQTTGAATTGVVRLAKSDAVVWRNNANSADLALSVTAGDLLQYNSIVLADISSSQTLTNKTMSGSSNTFTNLPASGLTGIVPPANGGTGVANNAASTLTIAGNFGTTLTVSGTTSVTLPASGTLATLAGSETFTNKTLTAPIISTISNSGTLTLPTGPDTLVGRATTDTLTNKTLTSPVIATITNTGTLTLPTSTDTLVGRATTDTLTNKTLTSPTINGGTHTGVTNFALRDTSAAFDVTEASTSSVALTAGRTRTWDMANASWTLKAGPLSNFSTLTDGSATQVLSTLGSGTGYAWASALTSTLNQYNVTVGNASNSAAATNTNLLGSITATTSTASVTFTNATPTVVTWTGHGLATGATVYFTASAMPTGVTASTTYYVIKIDANTFNIATTLGNALAGTKVAASSTGTTVVGFAGGLVVGANGQPGVLTNTAASSGYVGETLTQSITRANNFSLTSGTTVNVTGQSGGTGASIVLTAGDWDVHGMVGFLAAASTSITSISIGISATSATTPAANTIAVPTAGEVRFIQNQAANVPNGDLTYSIPSYQVTVASGSTLTLYLVATATFTASTLGVYGSFQARRMR